MSFIYNQGSPVKTVNKQRSISSYLQRNHYCQCKKTESHVKLKRWLCLAELKRLPLHEPQASITNVVEEWEEFTSTGFQEPILLLNYSPKSKLSKFIWICCSSLHLHFCGKNYVSKVRQTSKEIYHVEKDMKLGPYTHAKTQQRWQASDCRGITNLLQIIQECNFSSVRAWYSHMHHRTVQAAESLAAY